MVLAAGSSTRYGRLKQLEPVGPSGETLLDYGIYDAVRAGFSNVIIVTRSELVEPLRSHIASHLSDKLAVTFVVQSLEPIPTRFSVPPHRTKPWGTAHAILTSQSSVEGPFAVCNADDYYGPSGYRVLADFLNSDSNLHETNNAHALVGYRLRETLAANGGVARGICDCDDTGFVRRISEVRSIRQTNDAIEGIAMDSTTRTLTGDEIVSMNLWGFNLGIFPVLHREFAAFLETIGTQPKAEFLIGPALNTSLHHSFITLRLVETTDRWFGMTYPGDLKGVVAKTAELIAQGVYPDNLARGMAVLCN